MTTKNEIALQIYIRNVSTDFPLFYQNVLEESMRAADVWLEAIKEEVTANRWQYVISEFYSDKKIRCIKEVKAATGLLVKESKIIVDELFIRCSPSTTPDYIAKTIDSIMEEKGYKACVTG